MRDKQLIISVGREFGSAGHVIAEKLADYFNLPLYQTIKSPEEENRHAQYPINFSIGTEHTDDGDD